MPLTGRSVLVSRRAARSSRIVLKNSIGEWPIASTKCSTNTDRLIPAVSASEGTVSPSSNTSSEIT